MNVSSTFVGDVDDEGGAHVQGAVNHQVNDYVSVYVNGDDSRWRPVHPPMRAIH